MNPLPHAGAQIFESDWQALGQTVLDIYAVCRGRHPETSRHLALFVSDRSLGDDLRQLVTQLVSNDATQLTHSKIKAGLANINSVGIPPAQLEELARRNDAEGLEALRERASHISERFRESTGAS